MSVPRHNLSIQCDKRKTKKKRPAAALTKVPLKTGSGSHVAERRRKWAARVFKENIFFHSADFRTKLVNFAYVHATSAHARPNWGLIQPAQWVPTDHVTCAERNNLLVSLRTQESSPLFAHTHTHNSNAGENPRIKRSERLLLFLLSLFISLCPLFPFFQVL